MDIYVTERVVGAIGFFLGVAAVVKGSWKEAAAGSTISFTVTTAVSVLGKLTDKGQATEATLALLSHIAFGSHLTWLAGGGLLGVGGTLAIGSGSLYFLSWRRNHKAHRADPIGTAFHQAAIFLSEGLSGYLAARKENEMAARDPFGARWVRFTKLLLRELRTHVVEGRVSTADLHLFCEKVGGTLLTLMFEPTKEIKEFRLAVFVVSKDDQQLMPFATVDSGQWGALHSIEPLKRHGSFLGDCLDEGKPLVFPRDKKGHSYQKRQGKKHDSFVVVPLPSEQVPARWGGISVSHIGSDSVFDKRRILVLQDFARAIDLLYHLGIEKGSRP